MVNFAKAAAAVLIFLALVLGGYAWWLGTRVVSSPVAGKAAAPAPVDLPSFPVVVTIRPVAAGEMLTSDALRVVQMPLDPPGAFREVTAAIGRVPVADLGAGTPLMETQLASGLASRLTAGERAVAIRADEVLGVANRVIPGDFVDVFFVLKGDGREIERSQVRLLLPRQRVLAFGGVSVENMPSKAGETIAQGGPVAARPAEAARTAVLAVAVQNVARLALAEANGRLLLALRHPGDPALPDTDLFSALPTVLPVAGHAAGRPLDPVSQAHGGLAMTDLANGVGAGEGIRTLRSSPITATSRTSATASPSLARPRMPWSRTEVTPTPKRIEIESFRGDRREIVSY
jgi:pilus assembly protein CpaB